MAEQNKVKKRRQRVAVISCHTPSLFWFRMDMMEEFIRRGHRVFALGNEPASEWAAKFAEHGVTYKQIHVERNGTSAFFYQTGSE